MSPYEKKTGRLLERITELENQNRQLCDEKQALESEKQASGQMSEAFEEIKHAISACPDDSVPKSTLIDILETYSLLNQTNETEIHGY